MSRRLTLATLHLVADKFVDLPPATKRIWARPTAIYAGFFVLLTGYMTYLCGAQMLGQLLLVPALVVVHATPLIPFWSFKMRKLQFTNLKNVLGIFKSLFGACCIALMDTRPMVQSACFRQAEACHSNFSRRRQTQALAYTVLYDFVLETVFDLRDVDEDKRNSVRTLPVALGGNRSLLLLTAIVLPGDLLIQGNIEPEFETVAESLVRSGLTLAVLSIVVRTKSRGSTAVWGIVTLLGLMPAFWAQVKLLSA